MDNYFTIVVVALIFVAVFVPVLMVGEDSLQSGNLDNDSKQMLVDISYQLDEDLNRSDFEQTQLNISENASFVGVDPFARDSLEREAAGQRRTGTLERIRAIPDLIITSLGVPERFVDEIKSVAFTFIGIFIGVATFNLLRRGIISRR